MKKILIVEDEEKLRIELKTFLSNSGFDVQVIDSFENTVNDIINSNSDLVLLDINIPVLNGEIVCKEVRKLSSIPIIIVTSKNTEIDELLSLNYGADDFITKPYNTQILLARIERILQRNNKIDNVIKYKDLVLDISTSTLKYNDKKEELSKNELKIIHYMIINSEKIVSRDELMDYLWDTNEFIDDNTLTVNVNRLRNKLLSLGYKEAIKTKRGQGYILI